MHVHRFHDHALHARFVMFCLSADKLHTHTHTHTASRVLFSDLTELGTTRANLVTLGELDFEILSVAQGQRDHLPP